MNPAFVAGLCVGAGLGFLATVFLFFFLFLSDQEPGPYDPNE